MRRTCLYLCLAVLGATSAPPFVSPAAAYFLDGDELVNHCSVTVPDERYDPAICMTYIMGAYDGFMFQRLARNDPRCTPRNLTGGRLREVVVEYLLAHPENRTMDASALVWNAIITEWPACGTVTRR